MKADRNMFSKASRISRGSSLMVILPMVVALGIISASLMNWMQTEIKVNHQHYLRQQAILAAESALEYGGAQLAWRFDRAAGVPNDDLMASNNPLDVPTTASAHFQDSDVDVSAMRVQGGLVPPGSWMYIENTPGNEFDPLKGRYAFVREIDIYGKGVAKKTISGVEESVEAYAFERFQVRDAPLFGHAIFYNSTLEINPGQDLDVRGPVHANGDVYIGAKSSATLTLHTSLTAAGDIIHGEIRPVHIGDGSNVVLPTSSGLASMRLGNGSILDSQHGNWLEGSQQRWDGNVMDGDTGANTYNPVAIGDYEQDDYSTPQNETANEAYAIIEPLLSSSNPDQKSIAIREQKMEAKAGLVLRVEYDTGKSPGDDNYYKVSAYRLDREDNSDPLSNVNWDLSGNAVLHSVTLPSGVVGEPTSDFKDIRGGGDQVFEEYRDTETRVKYKTEYVNCRQEYNSRRRRYETVCDEIQVPDGTYEVDVPVYGGLYDHREDLPVDTVAIDIGALKAAVDAKDPSLFGGTYDVDKHWNGVVYVEFPTSNTEGGSGVFTEGSSSGRNSYGIVAGANPNLALMLIDGKEVPDPAGMEQRGFTVASNAPTYVVGNYNANGYAHTNDSTVPDDSNEPPAAIIADTVMILSNEWKDNRPYSDLDGRSNVQSYRDVHNFVEIAAAILTGTPNTVPTSGAPYGDSARPLSLGVVNLPRFLESWTSETLTIRGSLVSLFESEIRPRGAPSNFNDFYLPPVRDWGFSDIFANGAFPPGSPVVRSYRRTSFAEIDKKTFETAVIAMGGNP